MIPVRSHSERMVPIPFKVIENCRAGFDTCNAARRGLSLSYRQAQNGVQHTISSANGY